MFCMDSSGDMVGTEAGAVVHHGHPSSKRTGSLDIFSYQMIKLPTCPEGPSKKGNAFLSFLF